MSEYTPKLTLDNEISAAPAAPAAPIAPAAPLAATVPETAAAVLENVSLSPEEQKQIDEFAGKIDITDSALVMQYGSGAQKNIADFSSTALENVRTKDLGVIGDSLTELVGELRGFNEEADKKGVFGIFRSTAKKLNTLRARYAKTEANVDKIVGELDNHRVVLLKDIAMLDRMYDLNLAYFKELTMYILAGKKKLAEVRANEIPQLEAKAKGPDCRRTRRRSTIWSAWPTALKSAFTISSSPAIYPSRPRRRSGSSRTTTRSCPRRYRPPSSTPFLSGSSRWCLRSVLSIPARQWRRSAP